MKSEKDAHSARPRSKFNIEVTEKDIAKAKRNDSYLCVVSQAIARAIPNATRIEVDTQAVRFTVAGERLVFFTPYAVQGYVVAFDAGEKIEPFRFQLRNPAKSRRRIRTEAGKKIGKARMTARYQAVRAARAAGKSPNAPEVAAEIRQAATAAYAAAARANPGPESTTTSGRRPLRVFKRKNRSYGHRLLRINQQDAVPPAPQGMG